MDGGFGTAGQVSVRARLIYMAIQWYTLFEKITYPQQYYDEGAG